MAAYLIASLKKVSDQAGFEAYGGQVGPTMRPYGAKLLGELLAPARPHEVTGRDSEPPLSLEGLDALLAAMRAETDASGARLLPAPGNGSTW